MARLVAILENGEYVIKFKKVRTSVIFVLVSRLK